LDSTAAAKPCKVDPHHNQCKMPTTKKTGTPKAKGARRKARATSFTSNKVRKALEKHQAKKAAETLPYESMNSCCYEPMDFNTGDTEAGDAEADQFIDECPPWADAGHVIRTCRAVRSLRPPLDDERPFLQMLDEMLRARGLTR
jgi:hypothetical protein